MMRKDLFLILQRQWFDKIKSGEKTSEYRLATDYWAKRLIDKPFEYVTFQLGYQTNAERLRKRIIEIDLIHMNHEFFGNETVLVFEIKLGD